MYLDFFGLKTEPFGITPDPDFLFLSPSHKEALASIVYGVRMRKGFVMVTGEVGVGKTTVIRSYLNSVDRQSVKVVYLFNANMSFPDLMKTLVRELTDDPVPDRMTDIVDMAQARLVEYYRKKINVVLIIDEAQNMPPATLENLRMLSNLETTKEKLIQIILCGQPELDGLLNRTELRQLKQRIAVKVSIRRLTGLESRDYITHRLSRAAVRYRPIFTPAATALIVKKAGGIPRVINILCSNGLVTAFGCRQKKVKYAAAREAVTDMEGKRAASTAMAYAGAVAGVLLFFGVLLMYRGELSAASSSAAKRVREVAGALMSSTTAAGKPASTYSAPGSAEETHPPSVETAKPSAPDSGSAVELEAVPDTADQPETMAAASPGPASWPSVTRVVGRGDTLTGLTRDVYGYSSEALIIKVAKNNPTIRDVNVILEGASITFPVN